MCGWSECRELCAGVGCFITGKANADDLKLARYSGIRKAAVKSWCDHDEG